MPPRLKQVLVAVAGCAIAVTMLWLGLWQMRVYESKEQASAEERAGLPPIALLENVAADGTVGDVYGRQVSASGTFLPAQQLILTDGRVLAALEVADGRVLPVVRGVTAAGPAGESLPPPSGEQEIIGIFMPTEPRSDDPDGAVRLAALAQQWPQQLLPGFVTLNADGADTHGLAPAAVDLGTGEGSWQNYGYALQWWVFAGFAIFMTVRFVRALGRQGTVTMSTDQETL
ncbi:MAG: SURF1 family protein [Propionibacteriaceae bacterium]|nr:SURF1 family protein [Propionibacteriaceae bacterium]